MSARRILLTSGLLLLLAERSAAQDLDLKLQNDRATFKNSPAWIYDNLPAAIAAATRSHKPLLVVFRCIPCKPCQKFDDDVARRDPIIKDLLDEFVCVRIPQANDMDLAHFQFDYDLSFAVFFMDADLTTYGRFGTRSERAEVEDISLEGLKKAMVESLRIHRNRGALATALLGKQPKAPRFKSPRDYPGIAARFQDTAEGAGISARSCIHCHQVRDAERRTFRSAGQRFPESLIYPYPDPSVVGLKLSPTEMATIEKVESGSPADRAGLKPGDEIVALDGQPLLSIADVQWVLHNSPDAAILKAQVRRDGKIISLALSLAAHWRRGNISWRTTTWPLREMGFGGMKLENLKDDERSLARIESGQMALKIVYLFEYGDRIAAKRAGLRKGDIILSVDNKTERMTESELLDYTLGKRAGETVTVSFLRDGTKSAVTYALP